jgi:hypothetical protein
MLMFWPVYVRKALFQFSRRVVALVLEFGKSFALQADGPFVSRQIHPASNAKQRATVQRTDLADATKQELHGEGLWRSVHRPRRVVERKSLRPKLSPVAVGNPSAAPDGAVGPREPH